MVEEEDGIKTLVGLKTNWHMFPSPGLLKPVSSHWNGKGILTYDGEAFHDGKGFVTRHTIGELRHRPKADVIHSPGQDALATNAPIWPIGWTKSGSKNLARSVISDRNS